MKKVSVCWRSTVFSIVTTSIFYMSAAHASELDEAFQLQAKRSLIAMLKNISPEGTRPGVVVASPSRSNPDYWFHWIRDAALVMDVVARRFNQAKSPEMKAYFAQMLRNYASISQLNQRTPNRSGSFGEPKFHVDGSAYNGDWGRPQNDGPALRALTLIQWANALLDLGQDEWVRRHLYANELPTNSVIKADLEFVSRAWRQPDFDLWEEVKGTHFFTRMVQRRALIEGAKLAQRLGDPGAAEFYSSQARIIGESLNRFWDEDRELILPTLEVQGGLRGKNSGLDIAVILGVIHGYANDGVFGFSDDRVLSTLPQLEAAFLRIHPINRKGLPGVGMGRYPEDRYDGVETSSEGSPWFLATHGTAEFYYRLQQAWAKKEGVLVNERNLKFFRWVLRGMPVEPDHVFVNGTPEFDQLMNALKRRGDEFLLRVFYHMDQNTGAMAEQFNRHTGFQQGASDLTWSYASFLTAYFARHSTIASLQKAR